MAELELGFTAAGQQALTSLFATRSELDDLRSASAPGAERRAIVATLADRFAVLARHPDCPVAVGVLLHDWRDRLGSHVLVAEALADLEVHPDLADQMLQRGLQELLDEAPDRLAIDVDAARATVPRE